MKGDKIQNDVIRSNTGMKDIIERAGQERTVGRTCSQNEQHWEGKDNIRMDIQRANMRVAQDQSAWCELWRPSASSGMNS